LFPVIESYQGTSIQKNLKYLQKTQWLSKPEIEEIQTTKLRAVIRHAYNYVPYYRAVFRENGISPDDITTKKDLKKIPVLTKEIIRKNLPDLLATNIPKKSILERHSSGSTGVPLQYYIDKETYSFGWAQTFRCWSWVGYSLGDNYVKINLPRNSSTKKFQDLLMRCTYISAYEINENNPNTINSIAERIKKRKPVVLRGITSSVYLLALLIEQADIRDLPVKAVMTTGDTLLMDQRNTIEKVFNCRVFDAYGGEGTAVAYECEEHNGLHIAEEGAIVEYLNSNGEPSEGDYGEVCITNLTNYAMPFIRYNIQDIGMQSHDMCPCGRSLSLIRSIEGKGTDIFLTPSKKFITVHNFNPVLKKYSGIFQYQVIQEDIDKIRINIVKDDTYKDESTASIINEFKKKIGEDIDFRVEFVQEIPLLPSGKRRYVVSKIPLKF
jgi:phenylacetate-CoA ligase